MRYRAQSACDSYLRTRRRGAAAGRSCRGGAARLAGWREAPTAVVLAPVMPPSTTVGSGWGTASCCRGRAARKQQAESPPWMAAPSLATAFLGPAGPGAGRSVDHPRAAAAVTRRRGGSLNSPRPRWHVGRHGGGPWRHGQPRRCCERRGAMLQRRRGAGGVRQAQLLSRGRTAHPHVRSCATAWMSW